MMKTPGSIGHSHRNIFLALRTESTTDGYEDRFVHFTLRYMYSDGVRYLGNMYYNIFLG